jgi:hypothetical protein
VSRSQDPAEGHEPEAVLFPLDEYDEETRERGECGACAVEHHPQVAVLHVCTFDAEHAGPHQWDPTLTPHTDATEEA